ncbi:LamG domain-containing protein [Algibacillus agarilyticus]|uniref:LamG domain-containing protein n=1 Tax=Algibacillus agarilyticus TaxID=2234133 RepID=UPI000DD044C7|nr:LamG domain-containing protein [Algibacillus agarilyticus]
MRSDDNKELRTLIDAMLDQQASDGQPTPQQVEQLKQMLTSNKDAQRFYCDYVGLHTRLSISSEQSVEFVYRRLTEEEFIMRQAGSADIPLSTQQLKDVPVDSIVSDHSVQQPALASKPVAAPLKRHAWLIIALTVISLLSALFLWYKNNNNQQTFSAEILSGQFTSIKYGQITDSTLYTGKYEADEGSSLQLQSGETIHFLTNSSFKFISAKEIALNNGAIKINALESTQIELQTKFFTLHTNGSNLSVDLTTEQPTVKSGAKTLLSPRYWRPKHYWSFDGNGDRAIDTAGRSDGIIESNAKRTQGIIGKGAFSFDNTAKARLVIGNGGGSALGTGTFSATDGISIEALIKPNYSGDRGDSDHIFRKGQSDGELSISLSLQHDIDARFVRPQGQFNESISFGLFLLGHGYQKLQLPLDGLNGRPTLAQLNDGNYHHLVATYNASTGIKAIYLDGKLHANYQYPPSTKMLSGGAGQANIGNSPNFPSPKLSKRHKNAAFNGVIDEVAFYNFSLSAYIINEHTKHLSQGHNYFGLPPSAKYLSRHIKILLPAENTMTLDRLTGQPLEVVSDEK